MRQSVQALCVVTFDAPAGIPSGMLPEAIAFAVRHGNFKRIEPTACEVRAVREEAAMFNSNGDQFEVQPGNILRQGGDKFRLSRLEYKDGDAVTGWSLSPTELNQAARDVAEALNFMAGRVDPAAERLKVIEGAARQLLEAASGDIFTDAPECADAIRDVYLASKKLQKLLGGAPLPDHSAQMLAMLDTVLDVCDMADPDHENFADSGADCLQVIFENEEKIRALVAKVKGGAA